MKTSTSCWERRHDRLPARRLHLLAGRRHRGTVGQTARPGVGAGLSCCWRGNRPRTRPRRQGNRVAAACGRVWRGNDAVSRRSGIGAAHAVGTAPPATWPGRFAGNSDNRRDHRYRALGGTTLAGGADYWHAALALLYRNCSANLSEKGPCQHSGRTLRVLRSAVPGHCRYSHARVHTATCAPRVGATWRRCRWSRSWRGDLAAWS